MGKLIFNAQAEPLAPVGTSKHAMYVDSVDGTVKVKDSNGCVCGFASEGDVEGVRSEIYFGKGTGDITISENCFLCSECVYEVDNFIVCQGAKLFFRGNGVPVIKANCLCNMGTIDMYTPGCCWVSIGGVYVNGLGKIENCIPKIVATYTENNIAKTGGTGNGCGGGYDPEGVGAGGAQNANGTGGPMAGGGGGGWNPGCNGNQETGIGGDGGSYGGSRCCTGAGGGGWGMCGGGNGGDNYVGSSSYGGAGGGGGGNSICGNGGNGGSGCPGGKGGDSVYGNGGKGGDASTSCSTGGHGGVGGNSVYGNGGDGGAGYNSAGAGGCSLYGTGGKGGSGGSYMSNAGTGGNGRNGGAGGDSSYSCCYSSRTSQGGNAIGYNYPIGLIVKHIYNCGCILSCGGKGGNGGNRGSGANTYSVGGNGSDGGLILIYTDCLENCGCIDTSKGLGGTGQPTGHNGCNGKPGCLCVLQYPINYMDTGDIETSQSCKNALHIASRPGFIFTSYCTGNSDYAKGCVIYRDGTCCAIAGNGAGASDLIPFNAGDCIWVNGYGNTRIIYF